VSAARPVGIVGLGLVGTAAAARLHGAGFVVIGHDLDRARQAAFAAAGHGTAADLAALAAAVDLLVIAVFDDDQVAAVVEGLVRAGQTPLVICLTTCTPARIAALARRAAASGIALLEFPVSGTSAQLRAGEATGLLAGEAGAAARAAPVLAAICPRHLRIGGPGDAARAKLAINLILQANRAALAEGLVLAERMGLDGEAFLVAAGASAAYSQVMEGKGPKMLARDYAPQSRLAQTLKDAEMIETEAAAHGLALALHAAQRRLLRQAIALVGPDADSAAVIEAVRHGAAGQGA
jgi:3-hydroxyisobutyrate dehydrogenase-like beta-hydroxyacid dehydrogenase